MVVSALITLSFHHVYLAKYNSFGRRMSADTPLFALRIASELDWVINELGKSRMVVSDDERIERGRRSQ